MLQCPFLSTGLEVSATRLESHSSWFGLKYINKKTDASYTFQTCFFGTFDFLPLSNFNTKRRYMQKNEPGPETIVSNRSLRRTLI